MKGFFKLISSMEFLQLFDQFYSVDPESVTLDLALDRILSQDILSTENLPPFTRSTMDGFAVRAKNTFGCSESEPALLAVVGEILMGSSGTDFSLSPGQAVRIWTGGKLPPKADSVVMVEYTRMLDEKNVEIFRPVAPGENIIREGDDYTAGNTVLTQGHTLRPQELGVLAGLGFNELPVCRRPRVAIVSTGDELVPPNEKPVQGQIRDINSTSLAALVKQTGCIPVQYGIVGDDADLLEKTCQKALNESDVVLLSGGSSVGKKDYTLNVFEKIPGASVLAHGVSIRPGKPTILAKVGNKALFGLPGNVASAMVVFYLFVAPLLHKLGGKSCENGLRQVTAVTDQQIPSTIGREDYIRVQLVATENSEQLLAVPVYGKSGLLKPLVKADGLLVIGRDTEGLDQGEEASVLLFP